MIVARSVPSVGRSVCTQKSNHGEFNSKRRKDRTHNNAKQKHWRNWNCHIQNEHEYQYRYRYICQNAFEYWANCTGRDACKSTKDKRNKSGDVFFLVFSSFFLFRFVPIQEMNKTTTKTTAAEAQKSFALFSNFALYVRFCVCSTMALGSFFVSFFFHVDFTLCWTLCMYRYSFSLRLLLNEILLCIRIFSLLFNYCVFSALFAGWNVLFCILRSIWLIFFNMPELIIRIEIHRFILMMPSHRNSCIWRGFLFIFFSYAQWKINIHIYMQTVREKKRANKSKNVTHSHTNHTQCKSERYRPHDNYRIIVKTSNRRTIDRNNRLEHIYMPFSCICKCKTSR